MEGVVKFVNDETNVFAVETDNTFAVFVIVDADHVETGDVVSGDLESVACDSLFNDSMDAEVQVYVLDIVPTLEAAEALVLND